MNMNATISDQASIPPATAEREALRTSLFDRVSSFLAALAILLVATVGILFLLWLLSPSDAENVSPIPPRVTRGVQTKSESDADFLIPESNEVVDLETPSLQESITSVTDVASTVMASEMQTVAGESAISDGARKSEGDDRTAGPPGEPTDVVPRYKRWQLQFEAKDRATYAAQLDHFQIELGMVAGKSQAVPGDTQVLRNVSAAVPELVTGVGDGQPRLFFAWSGPSPLEQFDRQLFQAAGASSRGKTMVKYIGRPLEDDLARIELEYARSNGRDSVEQIAKTVFTSTVVPGGYQFVVTSQRYRRP